MRYYLKAAVLSIGWFGILAIPSWTRDWLIADRRTIILNLLLLAIAGLLTARLFRHWILSAQDLREDLMRGSVLPYVGCVLYLTLWNIWNWGQHLIFGGLANMYETLILYPWGLGFALLAFFVVIPYGIFCQRVLRVL